MTYSKKKLIRTSVLIFILNVVVVVCVYLMQKPLEYALVNSLFIVGMTELVLFLLMISGATNSVKPLFYMFKVFSFGIYNHKMIDYYQNTKNNNEKNYLLYLTLLVFGLVLTISSFII